MGSDGVKRAPWPGSLGGVVSPKIEPLCVKVRPKGAMPSLRETVSNGLQPAPVAPLQMTDEDCLIVMAFDAFRLALGRKPQRFTAAEIIAWLQKVRHE